MRHLKRRLLLVGFVALAVSSVNVTSASAYNGTAAKNYAETYAVNHNGAYYSYSDDCTNFVSQALRAGGHKFYGTPGPSVLNNSSQWWVYNGGAGRTYSWSVADSFGTFLSRYDPGVAGQYSQAHGTQGSSVPSGVAAGDPVAYIWNYLASPIKYNHASILVGSGTDPNSGWTGSLVNEHSTDRKHGIWHLRPYNSQWASTVTAEWHLSASA